MYYMYTCICVLNIVAARQQTAVRAHVVVLLDGLYVCEQSHIYMRIYTHIQVVHTNASWHSRVRFNVIHMHE